MNICHEEWRPVVGYEGYYDVSSYGRVRRTKAGLSTYVGKILKPATSYAGYLHVGLYNNRGGRTFKIHRLVAAAFIGPCPIGKQTNHLDGVKTNNRVENLEYCTCTENLLHGGRMRRNARSGHVKNIGNLISQARKEAGLTRRKLSEKSGYTIPSISDWECGREVPSERAIAALEAALGTKLRK